MKPRSIHCTDIVFVVLLLATLGTYALGEWGGSYRDICRSGHVMMVSAHGPIAALLALLTLLKGTLVAREFMGLRGVRLRWQAVVLGWLVLVIALVATAWWLSLR